MNPKILIVDDDRNYLEQLNDYLKHHQFCDVETAASKEEVFKRAKNEHFDVIITEMVMETDEAGFEIVKKYQGLSPILIIITAYFNQENLKNCLRYGAYNYINKKDEDAYEQIIKSITKGLKDNPYKKRTIDRDSLYINKNFYKYMEQYPGEYIAVLDEVLVGRGKDYDKLNEEMVKKYPFFRCINYVDTG